MEQITLSIITISLLSMIFGAFSGILFMRLVFRDLFDAEIKTIPRELITNSKGTKRWKIGMKE